MFLENTSSEKNRCVYLCRLSWDMWESSASKSSQQAVACRLVRLANGPAGWTRGRLSCRLSRPGTRTCWDGSPVIHETGTHHRMRWVSRLSLTQPKHSNGWKCSKRGSFHNISQEVRKGCWYISTRIGNFLKMYPESHDLLSRLWKPRI